LEELYLKRRHIDKGNMIVYRPNSHWYAIMAVAGKNSLSGTFPIQGFGDSKVIDRWVPFRFALRGNPKILAARISMTVKPIGDLYRASAYQIAVFFRHNLKQSELNHVKNKT